jgi:hypothetical protein
VSLKDQQMKSFLAYISDNNVTDDFQTIPEDELEEQ